MAVSEEIQRMILTALESMEITSANPTHINKLIQVNNLDVANLDAILEEEIKRVTTTQKDNNTQKISSRSNNEEFDLKNNTDFIKTTKKIKSIDSGNIKEIQEMTSKQFGNIRSMSLNPASFLIRALGTKIGKAGAKAGLAGFIALIAVEVANFVKDELYKPGRLLDPRFREAIDQQILKFMERREQQQLKQGFKQVITTTLGGLRGASLAGQIGGNFYYPERITNDFIDVRLVEPTHLINQDARALSHRGLNSNRFHGRGRFG